MCEGFGLVNSVVERQRGGRDRENEEEQKGRREIAERDAGMDGGRESWSEGVRE